MSTIASLNVYLNAETEGYSKGVEAATKETVRFMMQLDMQSRTMGMSATEAKLYSLQLRGVERSMIDIARQTSWAVDAQRAQADAEKSAHRLTEELKIQAATFKMTSAEAAIYRLQLQGVSKDSLDAARAAAAQLAAQQGAGGGGGAFAALNNSKGLAGIIKGGGPLLIFAAIANSLKNITGAIDEAANSSENWAGKMQLVLRGMPILRDIEAAGASINNWFTGTKQLLETENERTKVLEKQIDLIDKAAEKRRKGEEEVRKIIMETVKEGQAMTLQNDKARAEGVAKEAAERQKFAEAQKKASRDVQEHLRKAEGARLETWKKNEMSRLDIEEQGLRKSIDRLKKQQDKLPKEMKFANLEAATAGNMGIGSAIKAAMSVNFGADVGRESEKLEKEQLEVQRKIEQNTRDQKKLSSASFT